MVTTHDWIMLQMLHTYKYFAKYTHTGTDFPVELKCQSKTCE